MTNVPFAPEEAIHWAADPQPPLTPRLKTALRVDPLLAGDWGGVSATLMRSSPPYERTLDGCYRFVCDWVDRIRPVYLMASTPAGFTYSRAAPDPGGESVEGMPPSARALFEGAVMRVAVERSLPIALKVGAIRGVNSALRTGGDGVEVADLSFVRALCLNYPSVKLLLTVLSRDNQHELCVLARKFGNLHVYGCWWFVRRVSQTLELPPLSVPTFPNPRSEPRHAAQPPRLTVSGQPRTLLTAAARRSMLALSVQQPVNH